jgi:SUMO ligase MMS21 Smc5/6 complex component
MKEIQLAFEIVSAIVHQVIVITNDNYDEDKIIKGLGSGEIVTTVWHDQGSKGASFKGLELSVVSTGEVIGYVKSQEVDGEYVDYR